MRWPNRHIGAAADGAGRTTHGFTLIELLVVISIIAALVAMLLPALQNARMYAKLVICQANMRQVFLAINMYGNDTHYYPGGTVAAVPPGGNTQDPYNWQAVPWFNSGAMTKWATGQVYAPQLKPYINDPWDCVCPSVRSQAAGRNNDNPLAWGYWYGLKRLLPDGTWRLHSYGTLTNADVGTATGYPDFHYLLSCSFLGGSSIIPDYWGISNPFRVFGTVHYNGTAMNAMSINGAFAVVKASDVTLPTF